MRRPHGQEGLPPRPYIPPTTGGAVGALVASAVVLEGAWRAYATTGHAGVALFPVIGLMAFCLACAVVAAVPWRKLRQRHELCLWLRWIALGIGLATAASLSWVVSWQARCDAVMAAHLGITSFTVRGDPSINAYGASMSADARLPDGRVLGAVRLSADDAYGDGDVLHLVARLEPLDGSDWARSRFMKGEVASVQAVRVRCAGSSGAFDPIGALRKLALAAIEPEHSDARALIAGIVCGRTTELNRTAASDDFATAGLTHLVAVSGSHLAFIALLLEAVLRRLQTRPAFRAALLLSVMAAYVVFTGCAASAVRSVLMVGCTLATGLGARRAHPLSGLALTALVLVLLNPGVTFDLGFQLSAASVLFILVFGRYLAHLIAHLGMPAAIAEALSLTLAAQWATVPLTVPAFDQLSLVAPFANLLVGPVLSALLVTGLVIVPVCAAVPSLGLLVVVPDALARVSIFLGNLLAGVPFAALPVSFSSAQLYPCYGVALLVYVLWRDWKRWQLAAMVAGAVLVLGGHLLRWTVLAPAAITVMDVGQADAILVRDGASSMLVDAGVDNAVVEALARNHVYRLDAVAVTHWDRDHWGGLPDVLASVSVERLIVPEGASDAMPPEVRAAFSGEVVEMSRGDGLRVGAFDCQMVWPREAVSGDENADSLVLSVFYAENGARLSALLTGDTERDELAVYAPDVGDIDMLKVGHHGSKASVSVEALDVLDPELAVASAGEGNSYGHPSDECIETVAASGAALLSTIDAGDVTIVPGSSGPVVRMSNAGRNPNVRAAG